MFFRFDQKPILSYNRLDSKLCIVFVKRKEDSMSQHLLHLFSGTANRPLAERIAECLQMSLGACETKHLPDTEVYVEIHEAIRSQDIFFIQPCSAPVNDNLMELLLYIDAFRRASAHSITVVVPYFPYSRQERMAHGREAISARVVARMLQTLGVTRVVYVDIHAEATQGFFDIPVDPLSARKVFIDYFENKNLENPIIVAPDVGRAKLAGRYAEAMGLPLALMHKRRLSHSEVENSHVVGDLKDRTPIVIDDMIAGGSILTQLSALVEAGARPEIYLAITHPILLPTALARLDNPIIKELVVTDTVLIPPAKQHPKLVVLSLAPLLADAIERIHAARTISPLLKLTPQEWD